MILAARTPIIWIPLAAGWARSPSDLASGRGDVVAGGHWEDVGDHRVGHVDGGTGLGGVVPEPGFVGELQAAALGEDGASLTLCAHAQGLHGEDETAFARRRAGATSGGNAPEGQCC